MYLTNVYDPIPVDFGVMRQPHGIALRLFEYNSRPYLSQNAGVYIRNFREMFEMFRGTPSLTDDNALKEVLRHYPNYFCISDVVHEAIFEINMVREIVWDYDNKRYR